MININRSLINKSLYIYRYVGYIEGSTPIILVRDPELVKRITVKDFDHFVDHKPLLNEETEPLLGSNLFSMKGKRKYITYSTKNQKVTIDLNYALAQYLMQVTDGLGLIPEHNKYF